MPALKREDRIIRAIIQDHGPIIDLRQNPGLLIEIIRKYGLDLGPFADTPDGGPPLPGGVPPSPTPPEPAPSPGPTSHQFRPQFEDLMRELLKIQRKISAIEQKLG
jgi:hypothetical protein